jgi:hypothetical protein
MHMWRFFALAALTIPVTLGCGSKSETLPQLVPVSGTVTLDDKPLTGATVHFVPDGDSTGAESTGITDGNGKYELHTREGNASKTGAVPGKYRVWFSRLIGPDGKPVPADSETPPADLGARESLPPRLSDPLKSDERVEVSGSGGTIDFKLSKKARRAGTSGRMPR